MAGHDLALGEANLLIYIWVHFLSQKNSLREEDFSTEVKYDEPEWELCNPISVCT